MDPHSETVRSQPAINSANTSRDIELTLEQFGNDVSCYLKENDKTGIQFYLHGELHSVLDSTGDWNDTSRLCKGIFVSYSLLMYQYSIV